MEPDPNLEEIARLERIVGDDPAAPAFPALAEAQRRAGEVKRAEEIARAGLRHRPGLVAGRVALGLALLDQGRALDARRELERALEAIPDHVLAREALQATEAVAPTDPDAEALGSLADAEIDAALDNARPERDAMLDANDVAAQAMRAVAPEDEDDDVADLDTSDASPFATPTLASLLERQGHHERADALRDAIAQRGAATPAARGRGRSRVVDELERWLDRVSRSRKS